MTPNSYEQSLNTLVQQFINQNKAQLPALLKLFANVNQEFKELQSSKGTLVAVLSAYQTIDTLISEGFEKDPTPVSCHSCNAAYCCHQNVDICEAEAFVINQYCLENNIFIPKEYLQEQLSHDSNAIGLSNCSACVFLKCNRCTIYQVRPACCRTLYVATPQEFCDIKNYHNNITFISNNVAEIMKLAIFNNGGNSGRMPELLLQYSK